MTEPPLTWLDERGRRCPQPIIALARAVAASPGGTVLGLLSDDPAAQYDVPAWCRMKDMHLLRTMPAPDGAGGLAFVIEVPLGHGPRPVAVQA